MNKLYSDFVKTSVRFITSNDLEILTVDYLMKKAEQNNQAQEELDLIEELKVSRT